MLKANFHTHTTFCDGRDTPEEMVRSAIALGFGQIGFSGHMDFNCHMVLEEYFAEIRRLRQKYNGVIDIIAGIELDNMYDPACAKNAEYTIGSTHFLNIPSEQPLAIDLTKEQFVSICHRYFHDDYFSMSRAYYDLVGKSFDRMHCDIIGHFDLIVRFNDELYCLDESAKSYYLPALEAMENLCKEDVIFEVNCGAYNRRRRKELYPNTFLLKHLNEFGGRIMINSDAHQKELLSRGFDFAVNKAIECGFKYVNIMKHDENGKVIFQEELLNSLK